MDIPIAGSFEAWLAKHWGTDESKIKEVLEDDLALQFLISWSLLESKCFEGFAKSEKFSGFAKYMSKSERADNLTGSAEHFYKRYQNKVLFGNLMHPKNGKDPRSIDRKLTKIIDSESFDSVSFEQKVYLIIWVVFRYRNNIFHGNKNVESWLDYKTEISECIKCMQVFVDEKAEPIT